jgi:NAD(P)-dependent dehydrogenase (short-subunit alcohol dehydrogenase family)
MAKSVLVLGGATPNSIGASIVDRLRLLDHQVWAPPQEDLDVTEEAAPVKLLAMLHEFQPEAVVYSVGINELDWSFALTRETFDRIMSVNVWGFIMTLQVLQATGEPYSVLAITSDAAYRPMRTSMAYCASKAALDQAIRVGSRELAPEGWRINGLAPGKVDGTAMTKYVDERVLQLRKWSSGYAEAYELASSPIGRKLWPAEIAAAACDILLSDAVAWTGDIITVNGGR